MIKVGSAGSSGLGNYEGVSHCKELELGCLEVEFTYGVRMGIDEAKRVGELAKKLGIALSVHGPYYINLCSAEKAKVSASRRRILESCERAHYLGAKYVVFHAAFYGKRTKDECYEIVKDEILKLQKMVKHFKWDVMLAPETTGKGSQFGDIDELVRLSKETGCAVCIDFAHLKARNNGRIDYDEVMQKVNKIKHKTGHFSGIEWTEKGERRHLLTKESDIKELFKYLKKHNVSINIVNESPDPFGDAVKMKKAL